LSSIILIWLIGPRASGTGQQKPGMPPLTQPMTWRENAMTKPGYAIAKQMLVSSMTTMLMTTIAHFEQRPNGTVRGLLRIARERYMIEWQQEEIGFSPQRSSRNL
jgi:hypothetical protein